MICSMEQVFLEGEKRKHSTFFFMDRKTKLYDFYLNSKENADKTNFCPEMHVDFYTVD